MSNQARRWACWRFTIPRQERLYDQAQVGKYLRRLAKENGIPVRRIVPIPSADGAIVLCLTDTRRTLAHVRDELLKEFVDRDPRLTYQWPEVEVSAPPVAEELHYPVKLRRVLVERRGDVFYQWEPTG